jgi:RNA polymerase sigma-B factor
VRKRDGYSHLHPLFAELGDLPVGDPDREHLRERLIVELLPLAERIAVRFSGRGQPQDDLGEVRRFFRDTGWAVRVPRGLQELRIKLAQGTTQLARVLGRAPTPTELAGHLGTDIETVHEGLLAGHCYQTSLAPLLKQLPGRERAMLRMRFFDNMTHSQIAARAGVSRMQVSRVLTTILEELRTQLSP